MWIQEFDGFKKPLTNYEHSKCEQELNMWQEKYFATARTRTRDLSTNVFCCRHSSCIGVGVVHLLLSTRALFR